MAMKGAAKPLAGTTFSKGDTVRNINNHAETAVVTYVDETHDYAEMQYATGWSFRTRKSEWEVAR